MSRNVKDWARGMIPKLRENSSVFEAYLSGNETFAEAAITLIERLVEDSDADSNAESLAASEQKLKRILARVDSGEDAEAVVREEIQES